MACAVLMLLEGRSELERGDDREPIRLRPVLCSYPKGGLACNLCPVEVTVFRLEEEGDGDDAYVERPLPPFPDVAVS